jgi:hypothetical protein
MALDLAVISGYVMVLLARGVSRVGNKVLDHLLDQLAALINERIDRPTLKALQNNPGDSEIERVSHKLAAAAKTNRAFTSQLQKVIRDLDRHGGRTIIEQVINQVEAGTNVQAFGDHPMAAGHDIFNVKVPDPDDWSGAPSWVKATFGLGAVVCALGIAINFLMVKNGQVNFLGAGIATMGFVILLVGALGRMMSGRS